MKTKIARLLLASAALGAAFVPFTPQNADAGVCIDAGCVGNTGPCTEVTVVVLWKLKVSWECNGTMAPTQL
jgi:hypothetical protein